MGNGKKNPRNRGSSGRTLRGKKASLRGGFVGNFGQQKPMVWKHVFFLLCIYIYTCDMLPVFFCLWRLQNQTKHIWSSGCLFFWNNQDQFCSGMNEFGLVWSSGWQDFFWSISDQVHTDCRSSVRPIFFRNVGLSASIERRSNFPTPLNKQVNIWYWCGWKWWILKYECPIHVSWHHSPFLVNWVWSIILKHPHLMYQPSI